MAVVKDDISNPGTNLAVPQRRATLIKKATMPKVKTEIGRATSCRMGLIKVLTTPITTAVTTAAHILASTKPGTR